MPSSEISLPRSSTWAFDASVSAPVPAARSSTVLKPPYSIDTTATTTAMNAATQAVERVSLRAGLPILKTATETMMASASATPMTIKGTLIDSTIFHTSDQLMESIVDVLFQFRNPASQSQIRSLSIPVCVSIDMGRRRPEGRWEPPRPIQPHGWSPHVGLRAFCRIGRTICQDGLAGAPRTSPPTQEGTLPACPATDEGDERACARARPPRGDRAQ